MTGVQLLTASSPPGPSLKFIAAAVAPLLMMALHNGVQAKLVGLALTRTMQLSGLLQVCTGLGQGSGKAERGSLVYMHSRGRGTCTESHGVGLSGLEHGSRPAPECSG